MTSLLNALNVLILLALVLGVVWLTGQDAGTLTLTWHGWELSTTAAIGAIALLILLALTFYLGQFVSWLARFPGTLRNWFRAAPPKPELPRLVQALSLSMAEDTQAARTLLTKLNPLPHEEVLEAFARLHEGIADLAELESWLDNPHVGPYASLVKAQHAAGQANWALVRTTTQAALDMFGKLPAHHILHFKALLNLGETAKASQYFTNLRSAVPAPTLALVDVALRGPTPTTAAKLDDPWFALFQHWLTTPSISMPHAAPQTPKGR
ncbi:MAG: heme biosynthesis HemY N-terminal domain-containing protein [Alphaproteobacteria bacterium]